MEVNVRGVLERDERAPGAARDFVTATLQEWGRPDLVADCVLLVDELVTNALRHVRYGIVQLDLTCVNDVLRVDVSDSEGDFVESRSPATPRDLPRFGLRIVDQVADRWGVLLAPSGKSVWFEMDLRPEVDPVMDLDPDRIDTPSSAGHAPSVTVDARLAPIGV